MYINPATKREHMVCWHELISSSRDLHTVTTSTALDDID